MTPARLLQIIEALTWTKRGLEILLGEHETIVRRWADGSTAVPEPVAEWLEAIGAVSLMRPLPHGWPRQKASRAA